MWSHKVKTIFLADLLIKDLRFPQTLAVCPSVIRFDGIIKKLKYIEKDAEVPLLKEEGKKIENLNLNDTYQGFEADFTNLI